MINNEDIFQRLFEQGEKIIWKSIPYAKAKPELFKNVKFHISSAILSISLSLILSIFLYFQYSFSIFETIIFSIFMSFGLYFIIFLLIMLRDLSQSNSRILQNSQYFMTNLRIFCLVRYDYLTQLKLSNIKYYFFERIEKYFFPVYDLYLKTYPLSENDLRNHILDIKPMKDFKLKDEYKIQISLDGDWMTNTNIYYFIFKHIKDIKDIKEILNKILPNKLIEPEIKWKDNLDENIGFTIVHTPY